MPALCIFAKWCSKFPLTAWEGKASDQGLSSINEPEKLWRGWFFLEVLCCKGITAVWKINKLHHVQCLIEKTGWRAETWEAWVSYWTALWCGANHFACSLLCPVPISAQTRLSSIKHVYSAEHSKALVSLRLLGMLTAHKIAVHSFMVGSPMKISNKFLSLCIQKCWAWKDATEKHYNYNLFFWRWTFTTVTWSPLGGKPQLFQTAQEPQHAARTDTRHLQQEHGQDPTCSALLLPPALSLQANHSWQSWAIPAGSWPEQWG